MADLCRLFGQCLAWQRFRPCENESNDVKRTKELLKKYKK